jgi:hypothetical protein
MWEDEPQYAVKFVARVDEERAEDATAMLRESVAPTLRQWGFHEVLAVSRRLEAAESWVLRRLLEEALAESGYARHIRGLHETLVVGGPKSYAHSMLHHRDKETYPEEYRLIREAVESEDNWVTIPIRGMNIEGHAASVRRFVLDGLAISNPGLIGAVLVKYDLSARSPNWD